MATTAPSSENASTPAAVKISLPLVGISHPHTRTHTETKEGNGVKTYQQEIFNDIRSEDQLVILARGLGLLRIVTNLLHSYDAAGDNLVLLVGASEQETDWIGEGVCVSTVGLTGLLTRLVLALLEQNFISKAPKVRGLTIVTTDAMSVEGRCV